MPIISVIISVMTLKAWALAVFESSLLQAQGGIYFLLLYIFTWKMGLGEFLGHGSSS